jgi:hypothetical protein
MAIPRIISDRAATAYSIIWVVGFPLSFVGGHFHHPKVKWAGYALMAPFTIYVALMTVLSVHALICWFWRNRHHG